MLIEPKKIEMSGAFKRYFIAGLVQMKENPLTFIVLISFTMLMSYVLSAVIYKPYAGFLYLVFSFYAYSLWAEVIYSSRREGYNVKKFLTSFILAFDFMVKFIRGNKLLILGLFSLVLFVSLFVGAVSASGAADAAKEATKVATKNQVEPFRWDSLGILWRVTYFSMSSVASFYLFSLQKFLSDDYYYYRMAGAMKLKEVDNPVPSGKVNYDFFTISKFVMILALFIMTVIPVTALFLGISTVIIMMQYTFETYGDEGDKLKAEEKKKKEIEQMLPTIS